MEIKELREKLTGYRMPAEWEPHLATYLVWPHNLETWPGNFAPIPLVFAKIAAALAGFEPVRVLLKKELPAEDVRAMIAAEAAAAMVRVETLAIETNDSWIRDHGPIFVNRRANIRGPAQIALDFRFNSWGEKYGAFDLDDAVPRRLAERYDFPVVEPGIVLEGGSIEVNGAGSVLVTESCLLNRNRNPGLKRAEIEEYLRVLLGVSNVLWLGAGIAGDDTDGHVDDLTRFVAPSTVVTVVEKDPAEQNYKALQDNLARLHAMRAADGRPLRIETLPMPPALYCEGTRMPASYANFYIANGGVLMPAFGCDTDAVAAVTLARLFPGRRIVAIPSRELIWGLGSVHCLTQQHPLV